MFRGRFHLAASSGHIHRHERKVVRVSVAYDVQEKHAGIKEACLEKHAVIKELCPAANRFRWMC